MPSFFKGIKLTHFASYLPEGRVTNKDIIEKMQPGLNEAILFRAVGSKEKRASKQKEMGADLLAKVGDKILHETKTSSSAIDKLICSCDPVDQAAPDTAVITQSKLGLTCPA